MTTDTQKQTPKLRFPEFRNAPAWEFNKLGQLGTIISGLTYTPSDIRDKGLLVLRSSNIRDGKIVLDDCVYVKLGIKGANLSKPQDILVCVRNGSANLIGKNALIPYGMPVCTHGAFMVVFRAELPSFVYQLFQTETYKKQVAADLGARINSINNGQFINYQFLVPSLPEQQKIADCLGSLDEIIAAESQKLEALKTYKKGMMQQLFPAEGETVPKLRFPEFRDAPEWEEENLITYFPNIRNGFVGTATTYYVTNGIPYLQGKNIRQGQIYLQDLIKISEDFHRQQAKSQLHTNDIVMVQSGHVGECALVDKRFDGSNCHALIVMTPNKKAFSAFFVYYFYSQRSKKEIDRIKTGNTIEHILASDLKAFKVCVPNLDEQSKIADFLSSIDEQINCQTERLEKLRQHKQGMMQILFPSSNKVGIIKEDDLETI